MTLQAKKVFMRGQFTYFFFLEVSAKKRKTLEKKHGLWEIRSFISCQSRGGGKWIVRSVRFSFVPFISILHTLYHKVSTIMRFFTWDKVCTNKKSYFTIHIFHTYRVCNIKIKGTNEKKERILQFFFLIILIDKK